MSTETFARLALAQIAPSLTNPRKSFDQVKLQELADSIKASGVHQPVLLRPLPASRLEDTSIDPATGKAPKVRPTHELVAGERRYRASKLAGVPDIPAMVRDLSDEQVLEIQMVENLQRDDLSELEEAEGYRLMMDKLGLNAEAVGAKIGKSRAYVYARIKLLDLSSDAREALRQGKIEASTALLIARIPDSTLQAKALNEVLHGEFDGGKRVALSHRATLRMVQDRYMLALNKAAFDIKSIDLLPAAGACNECPKRTGASPDLFSDVKSADVCTDPTCFHKKEEAHAAAKVAEAEAKGLTVIAGKEAQELRAAGYQEKLKGYRRLDNAEDSPTDQPLRKIIGPQMKLEGIKPVLIEDPRNKGKFLECLPNELVLKLLKTVEAEAKRAEDWQKSGINVVKPSEGVQKLVEEKKAKAEKKLQDQFEREWRTNLLEDTWAAIRDDADVNAFDIKVHRFLAMRAARNLSTEDRDAVCKILNIGKVGASSGLVDHIRDCPNPANIHLLMLMQAASSPNDRSYDFGGTVVANEALMLVAGNVFPDLQTAIKVNKDEVKAKIWPKAAKKAPAPSAPLAQPKNAGGDKPKGAKGSGKKAAAAPAKLSAEEAKAGIAAAMQGVDRSASAPGGAVAPTEATKGETQGQLAGLGFAIGQPVQVTSDSSKFGARLSMHKWCGKKGTITGRVGQAWDVTFKGRSGGVASFDEDEISLVEGAAA